MAYYEELEELAERPFHVNEDGFIVIPKIAVDGMLTEAADKASSSNRAAAPEMVRTAIRASGWTTTAKLSDAQDWERFVVVTSGTGAKLSNQRALRINAYIGAVPPAETAPGAPVIATGTIETNDDMVDPETLKRMLDWAGKWIGIGASRKMGWGRYNIVGWEKN